MANYSYEIANAIDQCLQNENWLYVFDKTKGLFYHHIDLHNKEHSIKCLYQVEDQFFNIFAFFPIKANIEDWERLHELMLFFNQINYKMTLGNFDIDPSDGRILFRICAPCDDIIPTNAIILRCLCSTVLAYEQYSGAIIDILFNNMSAEIAYDKAYIDSMLQKLISLHEKK